MSVGQLGSPDGAHIYQKYYYQTIPLTSSVTTLVTSSPTCCTCLSANSMTSSPPPTCTTQHSYQHWTFIILPNYFLDLLDISFHLPRGASGDLSVGFGNLLNHFLSLPARIPLHLFVLNNVNHIQITSSITNVSFDPSFYSRKIFLVTEVNHLATQVNQQTLIGWKSHD